MLVLDGNQYVAFFDCILVATSLHSVKGGAHIRFGEFETCKQFIFIEDYHMCGLPREETWPLKPISSLAFFD